MATFCESWDSNWMDGSCAGFDENLDDQGDADAFEAALEPLPAWDGVTYSTSRGGADGTSSKNHASAAQRRRQHNWTGSTPHTSKEDHGKILNSLDLQTLGLEPDEGGDITGADSSVLRKSMLAGNNVEVGAPLQSWSTASSARKQQDSPSEPERTLTHVIRLHRTGSVVVERKTSPRASGAGFATTGAPGSGQLDGECGGFYAEEERFWRERCPPAAKAAIDRRGKESNAVALQRQAPRAIPSPSTQAAVGRAANYDYYSAEAAYRSSPQTRAAADPRHSSSDNDGYARRGGGASAPSRRRRSSHDRDGGHGSDGADSPPPPPPQRPRRQAARDSRGVLAAVSVGKRHAERRRARSCSRSLRDAEAILHGVLESVEDGLTSIEDSSPPSSRRALVEDRVSALRRGVDRPCHGGTASPTSCRTGAHKHRAAHSRGPTPTVDTNQPRHRQQNADSSDYVGNHAPSPSSASPSPRRVPPSQLRNVESLKTKRTATRDLTQNEYYEGIRNEEEEEEEEEEGDESAVRVAELSRRIAARCLHIEEECSRREQSQTRLFQEQLRGVRQAAQQVARQTIRDERSRARQLFAETQKKFEEREAVALAKFEQMEESWTTERETLAANLATAKSELERARRVAREAAEAGKNDAEGALVKQRLELQRGWAEEKGGLRRAAEDALRRVVDAKARAEEEAAIKAQTTQDSLNAQVRSWKAKAETAEKRAAEERDKRRRLEAGAKGALAQEVEKARQSQESMLKELRAKSETDRTAHAEEVERIKDEHRANLLRIHQDKKRLSEAAKRQWEQEMQEVRADAAAKIEDAAARSAAERAEALRRLRLAHDVEMRKAGRDILRLEREARRCHQQESAGVVARSKNGTRSLSPLPPGAYSPKPIAEAAVATTCLEGVEAEGGLRSLASPGFGSSKAATNSGDGV